MGKLKAICSEDTGAQFSENNVAMDDCIYKSEDAEADTLAAWEVLQARGWVAAAAIEVMADAVVLIDSDGRARYVNKSFERLLGYEEGEVVLSASANLSEYVKSTDREKFQEIVQKATRGEGIDSLDSSVMSKGGDEIPVSISISVIQDVKGDPDIVVAVIRDETKRKRAEEQILLAEERYRTIFENSAIAITVTDDKERIISWNKFAEVLMGMDRDDLYMRNVSTLYPEEEWKIIRAHNVRRRGMQHHLETRIIRKDGETIEVDLSLSVLRGTDGTVVGSIGIIADITERKRVQEQLRLAEAEYRTIFENSAVAITVTDENENIVSWNKLAEVLLGMDKNDLYMKPVKELYPKAEWRTIRSHNVRQKGMQYHLETRIIRKDQEVIDVDLSLSMLEGANNIVVGSIGIITDITERKRAEDELRRQEEYYRALIESSSDGIMIVNADGTLRYQSPSVYRMLGYRAIDQIGKNVFRFIHPDDISNATEEFARLLKDSSYVLHTEGRVQRKDGSWIIFEAIGSNLLDNPVVGGIIMNLRDITERKQMEEQQEMLQLAYKEQNDILSELYIDIQVANNTLQERNREIETLFNISAAVSQTLNLADLLDKVLGKVLEVVDINAGGIWLLDQKTDELILRIHRGLSAEFVKMMERVKIGEGFTGTAARLQEPVLVEDVSLGTIGANEVAKSEGIRSLAAIPIMVRDRVLGVLSVGSPVSREFFDREVQLLSTVVTQIGVAIENAQLYERAWELAFVDGLTGLYNRRYLMEQLEREFARAQRDDSALSLIMMDMDGLKVINDNYGHQEGDVYLRELGRIIKTNTRVSDVAARWGGDEFMLLATGLSKEDVLTVSERIRVQAERCRLKIAGKKVSMSVSIGVVSYPTDVSDVTGFLQRADEAMYCAKRSGKNRVCVY
ncbi:MAG: PAS domain S-box protein [Chloroflexota bacterium]|nr:PAS domain S-box protein [Chloroflexota bacterium]